MERSEAPITDVSKVETYATRGSHYFINPRGLYPSPPRTRFQVTTILPDSKSTAQERLHSSLASLSTPSNEMATRNLPSQAPLLSTSMRAKERIYGPSPATKFRSVVNSPSAVSSTVALHQRNQTEVLNKDLLCDTLYEGFDLASGNQLAESASGGRILATQNERALPLQKLHVSKRQKVENKNGILKGSYALVNNGSSFNEITCNSGEVNDPTQASPSSN